MEPVAETGKIIASPLPAEMSNLRKTIIISLFSTISFLIMSFLELPIIPAFPMLKYDASEIPAMLLGFSIGTREGIYVILLKNFLYILFSGKGFSDFGIGIFMSTFAGIIMVFVSSKIYLYRPTKKMAIAGLAAATIAMTVLMLPVNYLVLNLLPFFFPALKEVFSQEKTMLFIWAGAFPFNMIKGIITSIITIIIYKRISNFLKETGKLRG